MAVQGGFQRDAHRCLWQWRRGCWRLCLRLRRRWGWSRSDSCLAVAGSVQLGPDQLLGSPGKPQGQAMFTELPWGSLKIAAVAMTVCDVVHGGAVALAGDLRRPIR